MTSGSAWPTPILLADISSPTQTFLADAFDRLQSGELENFGFRILAVMVFALTALLLRKAWVDNFGRKPSLDADLAELRAALSGLAPSKTVDKLIEQLSGAATKHELAAAILAAHEHVTREVAAHKVSSDQQITDLRAYTHGEVHTLRNQVSAFMQAGEVRKEELKDAIEGVSEKIDRFSSDNYRRRRAMHHEINAQRTALAYMAGTIEARGDAHTAQRVRHLIDPANATTDGEGEG